MNREYDWNPVIDILHWQVVTVFGWHVGLVTLTALVCLVIVLVSALIRGVVLLCSGY